MPHSVSPPGSSTVPQEDSIIPDAPLHAMNDSDSSSSRDEINDNGVKQDPKANVELEDFFNDDDDEDEEIPSSDAANGKVESSPPRAPV